MHAGNEKPRKSRRFGFQNRRRELGEPRNRGPTALFRQEMRQPLEKIVRLSPKARRTARRASQERQSGMPRASRPPGPESTVRDGSQRLASRRVATRRDM